MNMPDGTVSYGNTLNFASFSVIFYKNSGNIGLPKSKPKNGIWVTVPPKVPPQIQFNIDVSLNKTLRPKTMS